MDGGRPTTDSTEAGSTATINTGSAAAESGAGPSASAAPKSSVSAPKSASPLRKSRSFWEIQEEKRRQASPLSKPPAVKRLSITLQKQAGAIIGVTLDPDESGGVRISELNPQGLGHTSGAFAVGDVLHEINGKGFTNEVEAANLLRAAVGKLTIALDRAPPNANQPSDLKSPAYPVGPLNV
jgi:hypothetical protein